MINIYLILTCILVSSYMCADSLKSIRKELEHEKNPHKMKILFNACLVSINFTWIGTMKTIMLESIIKLMK